MTKPLSLRALNRALLARQRLLVREDAPLEEVVAAVVALQAQWPKLPFFGLLARMRTFARGDLTKALADRRLVRATSMRATIHLTTADDYRAFRPTIARCLERSMKSVLGRRGDIELPRVLADARALLFTSPSTFGDLREALAEKHPKSDPRALGYAVRMMLPLVMEPTARDRWGFPADARFALAERWLGGAIDANEDRAALIRRYLAAHGPATVADAQFWTGLATLKPDFEALRPALVVFRDEKKRELFDLPDAPRPDEDVAAPPRLLPEFDHAILGHQDRARIVAESHRKAIYLPSLRVAQAFLLDGFAAGTWSIETTKAKATITLSSLVALPKKVREALEEEAERVARFAEPEATSIDVRVVRS